MMRHAIRGYQRSSEEGARWAPIRWESSPDDEARNQRLSEVIRGGCQMGSHQMGVIA